MPRPVVLVAFVALFALALTACGGDDEGPRPAVDPAARAGALPPLDDDLEAYAAAGAFDLETQTAVDRPDLHNVFRLGADIVSGGEPHGQEALAHLASLGIKTIVSVDGKVPDAEEAERLGMRYVHVPIQYSGIPAEERMRLAKAFRELEPPFYVHCFHGRHRGPAAAAWGRLVRDATPRERALAEMRQWCGTSGKYEGLYETIARAAVPDADAIDAYDWEIVSAHRFEGFRHAMIEVSRTWDHLVALEKRAWEADPSHPDLSGANEAAKLRDLFAASAGFEDVVTRPADFRAWLDESVEASAALSDALSDPATDGATAAFRAVKQRCDACHGAYRNQ